MRELRQVETESFPLKLRRAQEKAQRRRARYAAWRGLLAKPNDMTIVVLGFCLMAALLWLTHR
jgi:hypothetical protein